MSMIQMIYWFCQIYEKIRFVLLTFVEDTIVINRMKKLELNRKSLFFN